LPGAAYVAGMLPSVAYLRRMEPVASDWRNHAWSTGAFDTGRRPATPAAEGVFCTPQHLVIVTLRGGARHQEVRADCGHRFMGPDRPGAVSFVPAHCGRELKLSDIESEWASIALDPSLLHDDAFGRSRSLDLATFSNREDRFLAGTAAELARVAALDGCLDPLQGEEMALTVARYLVGRYGRPTPGVAGRPSRLPAWRLRRIVDHVEAHLDHEIRIADLAEAVGVSAGYLHRAFRASLGQTPLAFVNERRVRRAQRIIESEPVSMIDVALRIGFQSPSHFTRTFRAVTGLSPSRYRALAGYHPDHR